MAQFTDNCDSGAMSTNYDTILSTGWAYESGKARAQDQDNPCAVALKTATLDCTDDQFAECVVDNSSGMLNGGFLLRCADSNNHYRVWTNLSNVYFQKILAGTPSFLSTPAQTVTVGDTIRASCSGTTTVTLKFWINGVEVQSTDDTTSPLSGGQPGLTGIRNYNTWAFDSLRFGDGDGSGGGGGIRIADVGMILQVRRSRLG